MGLYPVGLIIERILRLKFRGLFSEGLIIGMLRYVHVFTAAITVYFFSDQAIVGDFTNALKLLISVFSWGWPGLKWITTGKSCAIFFKFYRCVLENSLKTNDKLSMVCSPLDNSLEIFILSQEHFVYERSYLVTSLVQF